MKPGTLVTHKAYRGEFLGIVRTMKDDKTVYVKVKSGWKGPKLPTWAVPIPIDRLEVVSDEVRGR